MECWSSTPLVPIVSCAVRLTTPSDRLVRTGGTGVSSVPEQNTRLKSRNIGSGLSADTCRQIMTSGLRPGPKLDRGVAPAACHEAVDADVGDLCSCQRASRRGLLAVVRGGQQWSRRLRRRCRTATHAKRRRPRNLVRPTAGRQLTAGAIPSSINRGWPPPMVEAAHQCQRTS